MKLNSYIKIIEIIKLILISSAFVAVSLCGCSTASKGPSSDSTKIFIKGTTTQLEVEHELGYPNKILIGGTLNSASIWVYSNMACAENEHAERRSIVLLGEEKDASNLNNKNLSCDLIISFYPNSKVKDYYRAPSSTCFQVLSN